MRPRIRQQRPQLLAIERHLRRIGGRIIGIGTIEQQQLQANRYATRMAPSFHCIVGLRMRIEQTEPAMAAAAAQFMIAAHQHPGRGRQQRRGRIEEVLLPYRPVVAMRAAGAAGLRVGTGRFAIVVVTDMDHQVRATRGGQTGDDGERPFHRVVAILHEVAFEAAAGIADHHDLLDLIWQGGNRQPIDGDARVAAAA